MATERKRKISGFDVVGPDTKKMSANGDAVQLISPHTGKPYSLRYFEIFEKRRSLPVWQQKKEFTDMLSKNQIIVLVGETGSGKTTQVSSLSSLIYPI